MRKPLIIAGMVLGLAALTTGLLTFSYVPDTADQQVREVLYRMGFTGAIIPLADKRIGTARYSGIKLDSEGFSSIEQLDVRYGLFSALTQGRLSAFKIEGLNLTGEVSTEGELSIAGWNPHEKTFIPQGYPIEALVIENSRIALLTRNFGGLSLSYDFRAQPKNKYIAFKANMQGKQKQMSFTAKAAGSLNKDGYWQSDIEIEQGKFELPDIRGSRINGWINVSGHGMKQVKTLSELRAGGLTLHGLPWQNAAVTLERTAGRNKLFLDSKSIGHEGLELSLNFEGDRLRKSYTGTLFTDRLGNLLDYLGTHNRLYMDRKALQPFENMENITLAFAKTDDRTTRFRISNTDRSLQINGKALSKDDGTITGTLITDPLFLHEISPSFGDGRVVLSGDFKKNNDTLKGLLKIGLMDGIINPEPVPLENLSGTILLDDLATLSAGTPQTLNCRLPLNKTIDQSCNVHLEMTSGKATIKELEVSLFDGSMQTAKLAMGEKRPFTVSVSDMDIGQMIKALNIKGLQGTGRMNGKLPFTYEDGRLFIQDGTLTSQSKGRVLYLYDIAPDFFKGDNFELETLRLALENYHYDFFEMRLSGPVDGETNILITARGSNPDLYQQGPVNLHFNTKVQLRDFLAGLNTQ